MTKPLSGIISVGAVALLYIGYLIYAGFASAPMPPVHYNSLILNVLLLAAILFACWGFTMRVQQSQQSQADQQAKRMDRLEALLARVQSGSVAVAQIDASTTTAPQRRRRRRTRKAVDGPNTISLPAPETVAAVRRLAQKVTDRP